MVELESPFGPLIETRLRVVTWNVWWQFGPWKERQPAIAATLATLDADIVTLQEVWDDGTTNQAQLLADSLGYRYRYETGLELDGVRFGNAILSRWEIDSHDVCALPAPESHPESRFVLRADIGGPRGPLQVFTTHLHWRLDHSHIRQDQVAALAEFVARSRPRSYPAIVAGDFNADPDSDEIRRLTGRATAPVPGLVFQDAWETAGGGGVGHTWSNDNPYARLDLEPARRIDYVFVGWPKEGGAGHSVHAEVIGQDPVDGVHPSDHYGVLADLRY